MILVPVRGEETVLTFKGQPEDGGLYTGYNVLRDGRVIGSIAIGGFFCNDAEVSLTEEEQSAIVNACKRIYEMPSEYGCLGVGESPIKPFDEECCRARVAVR